MSINKKNVRVPLQVSETFMIRLKELQRKIRKKTGDEKSLRQITDDLISTPIFQQLEENILNGSDIDINLNIRMDRRKNE